MFDDARTERLPKVAQWYRNYAVTRRQPWEHRPGWKPRPHLPQIFPILATRTAWVRETDPTYNVSPVSDPNTALHGESVQLADDMRMLLDAGQVRESSIVEIEKALWDCQIYGTGIVAAEWDPRLHDGLGDFTDRRVDPFCFYPDPAATDLDDAGYMFEVQRLSEAELERRFPGALSMLGELGDEDVPDASPSHVAGRKQIENRGKTGGKDSSGNVPGNVIWGATAESGKRYTSATRHIVIYTAWLRESIRAEVVDRYDAGVQGLDPVDLGAEPIEEWPDNPVTKPLDLRVDDWRCVVWTSNDVVLMDERADAIYPHGLHPYERLVEQNTGEFWELAMVDLLGSSQVELNKVYANILHNIALMGNPVMVEGIRAGLSRKQQSNQPGSTLRVQERDAVGWLNPPVLQGTLASEILRFTIGEMERISGISGMVRGANPTGRNASTVMDSLQEAAFVRIRLLIRNLEKMYQGLGNRHAANVAEFYTEPRLIAALGPSGEATAKALSTEHFYMRNHNGDARQPLRFRIAVDAGSRLAVSPQARQAQAKEMFALGAIDNEALLKIVQLPGWQETVARMREMQAQGQFEQPTARQAAGH